MTLSGEIGRAYRLQGCAILAPSNWVDLLAFTNAQATTTLLDRTATGQNHRFYRTVSP